MREVTQYWPPEQLEVGMQAAAAALAAGGVVAFPTETVYGLGGDARNTEAVRRIFEAKGRPADNPLIVHVSDTAEIGDFVAEVSDVERRLMDRLWPGPLTIVLPVKAGALSPLVTAGLDTVGVRVPDHAVARQLIALAGCPIAAPSANRSSRPSPTHAKHVVADLDGRIAGVLDGGPTGVGLESTVVRVVDGRIYILRPGGVTAEVLRAEAGDLAEVIAEAAAADEQTPRSPGVKYAHYAPQGEMLLVSGNLDKLVAAVQAQADEARRRGLRTGVLACGEHAGAYLADAVLACGTRADPATAAQQLYARLRECDELGLQAIIAEGFPEQELGVALMNRLRKAAGGRELIV